MKLTADEYEEVVCGVLQSIIKQIEGLSVDPEYGRTNKVPGASGHSHQIDVSIRSGSELYLVECKRWKGKISVQYVLAIYGRAMDIQAAMHGVKVIPMVVTTSSYQPGAITVAQYFGVGLQSVSSPQQFAISFKDKGHGSAGLCGVQATCQIGGSVGPSESIDDLRTV